jgi:hypothetical protein
MCVIGNIGINGSNRNDHVAAERDHVTPPPHLHHPPDPDSESVTNEDTADSRGTISNLRGQGREGKARRLAQCWKGLGSTSSVNRGVLNFSKFCLNLSKF